MKTFRLWMRMMVPFWAVQFFVLVIGTGPSDEKMSLWYILSGGFSLGTFLISYWATRKGMVDRKGNLK